MKVLITTFAPANDSAEGEGFHWFRLNGLAVEHYWAEVKASVIAGDNHIVRLLSSPELDINLSDDEITQWIENNLDKWELSEPPLEQHIPPNTAPDRLPKNYLDM